MSPENSSGDVMGLSLTLKRCSLLPPLCSEFQQFPDDVLIEILCRLPLDSLMKYKCVCKSWHRIISYICIPRISYSLPPISGFLFRAEDRHFQTKFEIFMDYVSYHDPECLDEASVNPALLVNGGAEQKGFVFSYSALLPFRPSPDDLLDACKGLLLFVNGLSSCSPQYYVCNPTTKQCVSLPKASFHMESCFASLAFDPHESPHYKVVRFPNLTRDPGPVYQLLDIFSSDAGRWVRHKVLVEPSDTVDDERLVIRRSCYLQGVLYRLTLSKRLLCFNIRNLTRQAITLPRVGGMTEDHGLIGVSKGLLHYANRDQSGLKVWVLNDTFKPCHGNKSNYTWILKHSISFDDTIYYNLCQGFVHTFQLAVDDRYKLYAIDPTYDIIYIGNSRSILTYHLDSNTFQPFCGMSDPRCRNVVLGEFYVFCHSICYVVLNQFREPDNSWN